MDEKQKNTALNQLSILAQLSKADNYVADSESNMIHYIGKLHGFTPEEIETVIDNPTPVGDLKNLDDDDRFDYLFNIIQLMKIDGQVLRSEIEYCEKLAMRLGYLPGVIAEMSAYIYSDPKVATDKQFLRKIADNQLMNRGK